MTGSEKNMDSFNQDWWLHLSYQVELIILVDNKILLKPVSGMSSISDGQPLFFHLEIKYSS